MNQRTSDLASQFTAVCALLVYHKKGHENSSDHYYLELRKINKKGEFLAGQPLDTSTTNELADALKLLAKPDRAMYMKSMIPETLLGMDCAEKKLIFWTKPHAQFMYFDESLRIPDGIINVPGLVFNCSQNQMIVYAFKGDSFKIGDPLFRAPFHNIAKGGNVCLGSAKVRKPSDPTVQNYMNYYLSLFWNSKFSHLYNTVVVLKKGNINSVYKSLSGTDLPFPVDDLVPVKNIIKSFFVI